MSTNRRFYEIDLVRFAAAFAVMLFHYSFRGYAADGMTVLPYLELAPFAKYGYLGVDLFFMISGFVIFMTAYNNTAQQFVISRMVRLYPAFWACCTATFVVSVFWGGKRYDPSLATYIANMTMLSGFLGIRAIDGVYWTLFVEMKFYFLVFLVVLLRQMHRAKYLLGAWLVATMFLCFWDVKFASFFLMPKFAHYFIAGAAFYLISLEGACWYKIFLVVGSFALSVYTALEGVGFLQMHFQTYFSSTVIVIVLLLFYFFFSLVASHLTNIMVSSTYLIFGALTYPLYLLHENIGFIAFNNFYPYISRHVLFWGAICIMLFFAYLVHKKVEQVYAKPFRDGLTRLFITVKGYFRIVMTDAVYKLKAGKK